MMPLFYKSIQSSFEGSRGVVTLAPSGYYIVDYLFLLLAKQFHVESSAFLLHENALIEDDSGLHFLVFELLEYDCACKFFLPESGIVGEDLDCVFEEGIVDGIGIAFFEVAFYELYFLFKIFGGL